MKKWNYVISALIAVLGVVVLILSSKFPAEPGTGDPGAGFWPSALGGLLAGLAVVLAISNTVKEKKEAAKEFALTLEGNKRVYMFMAATVVYCVILYFLGFIIATLLFIPSAMYMLDMRDKKAIMVVDIVVVAAIFVIFRLLLKTPLPNPIFMR